MRRRILGIHRRSLYKLAAVLLGLGGVVLIVELGLRVGWLIVREDPFTGHAPSGKADVVILCAGDSHTQGIGAPEGLSYPDQLSALLNASDPSHAYQVINIGQSGFNSSQAVNRVLAYLEKGDVQPDIVIFCAGGNNDHNFMEARFLPEDVARMSLRHRLSYLLAESRAYRLGQITIGRIRTLLESMDHPGKQGPGGQDQDEMQLQLTWQDLMEANEEEVQLLRDWLRKDLEHLWDALRSRGIHLLLMNYFHWQTPVDSVFAQAAEDFGIFFVDVRGFGDPSYDSRADRKGLVASNWHPNEYGYRKIVPLIVKALRDNRMIPPPAGGTDRGVGTDPGRG